MPTYIYQLKAWPGLSWNQDRLADLLAKVRLAQGRLLGQMESLGFNLQSEAVLQSLTEETIKSSQIEGDLLDQQQVRSSIARRLGMDLGGLIPASRHVEGVVEMMLDATQKFDQPLTMERLCRWHAALFPAGKSGLTKIRVGCWRDDANGPMQVVSGLAGKERVHFQAPPAGSLPREIAAFTKWFNNGPAMDGVLKAGAAHLWFVTLHPFDDGNGRIARAISDLALARSDNSPRRFYSMSAQILAERALYYEMLEATQKGGLDITAWQDWFLQCLGRAFTNAESVLADVLKKARFWKAHANQPFNERQQKVLNLMLGDFEGKLTSSKWAKLGKCSQDTAARDMEDLVKRGILARNPEGGRSTSFSLKDLGNNQG